MYVTWAGGICLICMHGHEGEQCTGRVKTYQENPNRTCYICYVTFPALQKSAKLAIRCTAYNDWCCLWLWVFNSNVSMTFIKIHCVMHYF